MQNTDHTDEKCRKIVERLKAITAGAPEGSFIQMIDKKLLDFSIEEKWIDFAFTVDDRHINIIGTAHGGVLAGLADECMGFGAAALIGITDEFVTTSDMQFNCMKTIFNGDRLRVHVRLRHVGRRSVITTAEIFSGEDLVFMATENLFRISTEKVAADSRIILGGLSRPLG